MRKMLALLCAVWIAVLPSQAFAQSASQGNNGAPTQNGGTRVLGTDGTSDRFPLVDNSGRLDVQSGYPGMEVINHLSNRTVASAGIDSSGVPQPLNGYRQMFALFRVKAATFAAASHVEIAFRCNVNAQTDSTAAGWWALLGKGLEHGKTINLANGPSATNGAFADRYWMIPITDSLTFTPAQAPYGGFFLRNLTGAQLIYDLWILGVR